MEKFNADKFHLSVEIATVYGVLSGNASPDIGNLITYLIPHLESAMRFAEQLYLRVTAKSFGDLLEHIKHNPSRESLIHKLDSLSGVLKHEMETHLFFYVSPEKAKYYKPNEPLFGKEVHDNFPSAQFDTREAGNCFCFGRQVACVFHLSRVIEAVLDVIDKDLGFISRNTTWKFYTTSLHTQMLVKYPDTNDAQHKKMRAFYSGMEDRIRDAKDAWRNDTIHDVNKKFTDDEAEDLILSVRSLMRHAAQHLKETP